MSRFFATITVLGMMLIAIIVCIEQTVELRDEIGGSITPLIALQILIAIGLIVLGATITRRHSSASRNVLTERRLGIVQPLRRLLSTVWS